jgi:hypothetical protein
LSTALSGEQKYEELIAPSLYPMVQQLCDRANLPMLAIYIFSSSTARAFAQESIRHWTKDSQNQGYALN